jgi:hypothetical protein
VSQTNPKVSLQQNTLKNIIKRAADKYDLEEGEMKTNNLKGRFRKTWALHANGWVVNSPMFHVEKFLISMILCQAAMRQPYTVRECLEFANSLIDKSVTQVQLVVWKQKKVGHNLTEENECRVGLKWWRNFVKMHKVHLSIREAVYLV